MGREATNVELVHHKFETMGAEAGASMRKDVDGGWPGLMQRFVEEAERAGLSMIRRSGNRFPVEDKRVKTIATARMIN